MEMEMGTNQDYSQLLYYWENWREKSGRQMIGDFKEYVILMNEAAEANGKSNFAIYSNILATYSIRSIQVITTFLAHSLTLEQWVTDGKI